MSSMEPLGVPTLTFGTSSSLCGLVEGQPEGPTW